ncbi:MAG: hypothetical protein OEW87_12585, partial [Flavobacteriaceae bacterium]|nr:hypothetical protein [Flavobacteriaceae bacterium]
FNKHLANIILKKSSRESRIFGSRYKWCLVKSQSYLYNCYRYVYQNPVRAKLVNKCENYPYSTLFYKTRGSQLPIALYDIFGFKDEFALHWLNVKIDDVELFAIRNALKKTTLEKLVNRSTRAPIATMG